MKKKVLSLLLTAALMVTMVAGCGSSTGKNASAAGKSSEKATEASTDNSKGAVAEKDFKILSIWAEDSTEGKIIKGLADKYIKEVNPKFSYEYEYVASSDLSTKIATLVASDDLPDLFVYSSGAPLKELIKSDKVVNISQALTDIGCDKAIMDAAKSSLLSLSDTKDLYDLPFGMNIEGFWYNKAVFTKAGVEPPKTWDELLSVCDKLKSQGIQPLATGGADKWPTTRLVNAYTYRSLGADAVKKASQGDAKFTDAGYVAAAQMVADMAKKGYLGKGATTVDNTTAEGMLLNGSCAMLYDGSWFSASVANKETNPSGEDNIGFMGIPVVDKSVSPAEELPTNCGNVLCLSKSKYDKTTQDWLKYFVSNVGDYAMTNYKTVKGYTYTVDDSKLSPTLQTVLKSVNSAKSSTAWWEAYMNDQTKAAAQDNIQSVLNGDLDGQGYCKSIQEAHDLSK